MMDWAESERCKGGKVRRWAGDFGCWMLDDGFMEEVERSFPERSRRRKWCEGEKVGKWESVREREGERERGGSGAKVRRWESGKVAILNF